MDLKHLQTFRTVATMLSFSRAADSLNYAQSTITAQIQSLESELGVPLFNRLGRQIELTEAGQRLLGYSDRLLNLADETRQSVTSPAVPAGTLTVGAPETVCTYRLPQVLKQYRLAFPDVRLVFCPMPYERLFRSIRDGMIDIAFLLEKNIQANTLEIEILTDEPLVIVAAPNNPLVQKTTLRLTDLAAETFLFTERGCGYRTMFERELQTAGVHVATVIEFDSVEAIKQCVIANIGIATLPLMAVSKEIRQEELVPLAWSKPDFMVHTHMLWHQEKWISPAMGAFMNITREVLRSSA